MIDMKKLLDCAGKNIAEILNSVDVDQIEAIAQEIAKAKRVYTAGWGRAGNIIRILGMNMSQIGMLVYPSRRRSSDQLRFRKHKDNSSHRSAG